MFNKNVLLLLLLFLFFSLSSLFVYRPSSAATMFHRSVIISSAVPSAVTSESFQFDIPSASVLGSIVFQYCANSPSFYDACIAPSGLDVSAASLDSQSGNTGFSIDSTDTTPSKLVVARAATPGAIIHNAYNFGNITNPSAATPSIFVRISTYSSTDGGGIYNDTGAVAFAIQNIFIVGAFVPPFLQLCVAITVAPDCSAMAGDSLDLGILSAQRANAGQSQFATATNDPNGYTVFALGNTMTSGNNTIQALGVPTASFPGTQQFGINLRANLLPPIGQDPVGLGTAVPAASYNIPNKFIFTSGDSISSSPLTTNYNRMTVSYLVNVPSGQPPGVYATTITYVATVQF